MGVHVLVGAVDFTALVWRMSEKNVSARSVLPQVVAMFVEIQELMKSSLVSVPFSLITKRVFTCKNIFYSKKVNYSSS